MSPCPAARRAACPYLLVLPMGRAGGRAGFWLIGAGGGGRAVTFEFGGLWPPLS
jgi:hypothetical protein